MAETARQFEPLLEELEQFRTLFLAELDRLREQVMRLNWQRQQSTAAPVVAPLSEWMTVAEVAALLEMKRPTVAAGDGGTRCLFRCRVKQGGVRYPRAAVELHQRHLRERGACDSCDIEYRQAASEPSAVIEFGAYRR